MAENALENAFIRLPRPQKVLDPKKVIIPTKSALLQAQIEKVRQNQPKSHMPPPEREPADPKHLRSVVNTKSLDGTPLESRMEVVENSDLHTLGPVITLGVLTQDGVKWALRAQRGRSGLLMVKKVKQDTGAAERRILETISHRNIAKLLHVFDDNDLMCLAMEYSRFTLAEVFFVHLRLEEQQIQCIARSVRSLLFFISKLTKEDLRRIGIPRKNRYRSQLCGCRLDPHNPRSTRGVV
jgi:serine/threonine protein kinase